jgi:hypothetical protein
VTKKKGDQNKWARVVCASAVHFLRSASARSLFLAGTTSEHSTSVDREDLEIVLSARQRFELTMGSFRVVNRVVKDLLTGGDG